MNDTHIATTGIVLSRTEFGEADRIITFLTPDHGKVKAIAKGVRRSKSKLKGGVELFSVNELTFLRRKSEMQTLVSARLVKFYGNIMNDIERTQTAYDMIKTINSVTEAAADPEFFYLLQSVLAVLDMQKLNLSTIKLWFDLQLLSALGNEPNLTTDTEGQKLETGLEYSFDLDHMSFFPKNGGGFTASHIKLLRLALSHGPTVLQQVKDVANLLPPSLQLVQTIRRQALRV